MKHPLSEHKSGDSSEMCFSRGKSRLQREHFRICLRFRRLRCVVVDGGCVQILWRLSTIYTFCCRGAGAQYPRYWQAAHGKEASRAPEGWAEWAPSTRHSYNCSWKKRKKKNMQSSFVGTLPAFWKVTLRWDGHDCSSEKTRHKVNEDVKAGSRRRSRSLVGQLLRATNNLQSLRDRAPWCDERTLPFVSS